MKKFTQMEYKDPDEMLFGHAKYPVTINENMQIGGGYVIPEINVAPGEGTEESKEKMISESRNIAHSASGRAVSIGLPAFILEQEHIAQQTYNPDWAGECTQAQVEMLEKYSDEYGVKTALRATPADIRDEEKDSGFWDSDLFNKILESMEACAASGANILSIETTGGKSVSDYGISRGDPKAILFGIGVLGSRDMEYVWNKIVPICKKYNVIPGGDTDCSQANTAMFLAGGLIDKDCSHTLAALARAMAGARSLVAVECGAMGPLKDCGYENPIVKAISGVPISAEGKDAVCAHSDLMGNLAAAVTDMWSNESVYHREEMGGTTPEVWLQATGYEAALMNTAIETGEGKTLRDLYTLADKYRDPQALVLAYDNAYRIGEAIVEYGDDYYLRAKAAAIEAGAIINEAVDAKKMQLTRFERDSLDSALKIFEKLPDDADKFTKDCIRRYSRKVADFDPKNYEL
ncbi:methanol--corrinoid methyltransferase [Methanobrevibacter sp. TMH8]|uniref:methanol--corrinoid protein co-methyltransferase MtaB n=1 Tax=Methanobrevibacter sp. TMH8 TaxID=2848611 RepID=UPI001CCE4425|nr:methanol--corrinoid protein co-methyltransferase MtaB [Methanobrevibacter sp. TMH8]MBZ9571268.1 methanol--corrinoid methyltransferase [Methanobrevibacter sp. TMH8]